MRRLSILLSSLCVFTANGFSETTRPFDALKSLEGCYLVDYTYSELETLDEEYQLDPRVYDVSSFTVKELFKVTEEDNSSIRMQHFMEASKPGGKVIFRMRHHGETWHKSPDFHYVYQGRFDQNDVWTPEYPATVSPWVRKIWSLDDGLRYQCPGDWDADQAYPTFTCEAYSPIPGRETRDMGRKDYNTLDRKSTVQIFPNGFLERQDNIKTLFKDGRKKPLAKELGKIWSTEIAKEDCVGIEEWAEERQSFWDLLSSEWKLILEQGQPIREFKIVNGSTRSTKIRSLLARSYKRLNREPGLEESVRSEIRAILKMHLQ